MENRQKAAHWRPERHVKQHEQRLIEDVGIYLRDWGDMEEKPDVGEREDS
jgi:hypothetical protein